LESGHNTPILGALAEYNTNLSFVVMNNFTLEGMLGPLQCNELTSETTTNTIHEVFSELAAIVAQNNVQYINWSSGFDQGVIKIWVISKCPADASIDQTVKHIERAIADGLKHFDNHSSALLIQSAPYAGHPSEVDCDTDLGGRILIGAISGEGMEQGHCMNVSMDLGLSFLESNPKEFRYGSHFGLGQRRVADVSSTSLAAPLAASWISYLRKVEFASTPWSIDLRNQLKSRMMEQVVVAPIEAQEVIRVNL